MDTESDFCGCVYDNPISNKFAPQEVGDLTVKQLRNMPLVGLPIRASHGKFTQDMDIGVITDEFYDAKGGKHISFRIHEGAKYDAYREGIRQNWYSHLSLGHEVRRDGVVAKEVSICHLGARPNTTISRTTPDAYKLALAERDKARPDKVSTMSAAASAPMNTASEPAAAAVAAAPTEMNTAPDAGESNPVDETPEEKALRVMGGLEQEQQEAIAAAWTLTSKRLEAMQEQLTAAEKIQGEYKEENEMLRKASQETAKQLVSSLKEAYTAHGTEMPERYHREIQQQVNQNPTLAQALSHCIPVCASALSRKRPRTEEPSSFTALQGYLRAHVRESGVSSFQGDFSASQSVPVNASNTAVAPADPRKNAARLPVEEGPGRRMLEALRASLHRG